MNPGFWRITFLGNRPQLLLARGPSDGFLSPVRPPIRSIRDPPSFSLFPSLRPVLYFQLYHSSTLSSHLSRTLSPPPCSRIPRRLSSIPRCSLLPLPNHHPSPSLRSFSYLWPSFVPSQLRLAHSRPRIRHCFTLHTINAAVWHASTIRSTCPPHPLQRHNLNLNLKHNVLNASQNL